MKKVFSTLVAAFIVLAMAAGPTAYAGEIKADSLAPAKKYFTTAKAEIEAMLLGRQPLSYERAIYLLENAYWEGAINTADFSEALDEQTAHIRSVLEANRNPKGYVGALGWMETEADRRAKYDKAMANFAIFTYLTDTTFFVEQGGKMRCHLPVRYTHRDPMGSIAWQNTQVSNLLQNGHGNCFALASLYYIFSERLGGDATLCTAPGHLYISHPDDKGTRFNLELSSGTFPGNGTLMTQSYATMDAVRSGIALRELNRKQAIGLTLVYLAKGYAHKFGAKSDAFVLSCAEGALRADSLNLNAMLLKAEVLENRLLAQDSSVAQLQSESDFREYEALVARFYRLGYREMPLEMKNILMAGFQRDTLPYKTRNHTSQPFRKYGMENDRHASLSWGLFDETHETKPRERYGRTLFDTKSKRITGFAEKETLYNGYDFDPVAFAWNVDPLAHKFPQWSPYSSFGDNPILNIDPDGRAFFVADPAQRQIVLGYLKEQLGTDLFSFNKHGLLQLDKSSYKAAKDGLNDNQKSITEGMMRIVKSPRILEARLFDNPDINFTRNPVVEKIVSRYDDELKRYVYETQTSTFSGSGITIPKLDQAALTFYYEGDNRAFILFNYNAANKETYKAVGGGETTPCASCLFIHESLDHGLDYINTGSMKNTNGSIPEKNVEYQNKGLENLKYAPRTGEDHTR